MNETLESLSKIVGYQLENTLPFEILVNTGHRFLKDLKVNVSNALTYASLSSKESYLLALSVAINDKQKAFIESFTQLAKSENATNEEIAEVYACVSLLNTNNVFYRFRHFTQKDYYESTPAGIKMSIMMNPVLGKEFFELMSLAVSAINGCERCVRSHEESLMKLGTDPARVYDAIRLTAIIRGLAVLS
jgi:alkyl hydroperoxide reductase subunit D